MPSTSTFGGARTTARCRRRAAAADHLAEYRAATPLRRRRRIGQLHGWGAEREPLQVECMKERTRADELALELERANARNQEPQLRITRSSATWPSDRRCARTGGVRPTSVAGSSARSGSLP